MENSIFKNEENNPVFIIGELSANHGGNIQIAKDSILAIKKAGADAVKIQTYTPDTITIDCDNEYFQINEGTVWDGVTLYDLYKKAYTPWEWHKELYDYAKEIGIIIFSSPFDNTAVDLLESLNNPLYKIASFEITDIPLIEYVASKNKPMIISTGIATKDEIKDAIDACRKVGNNNITLLKCTSSYPAPYEEINLKTMVDMKDKFKVNVGLSDHSLGMTVALGAVALGAKIIEKHFILDKSIGGPDATFSMEFDEFKKMVVEIRKLEKSLGKVNYNLSDATKKNRVFSRSLFVIKNINQGEIITKENVRSIRPGYGISPKHLNTIMGKKVTRNVPRGTPVTWDLIE